jgi:hypothetical protein
MRLNALSSRLTTRGNQSGGPHEFVGSVRVEGFNDSVAGDLLGPGDPREGFAHGSLEQMLSEPIGDRSAPGDLRVTFPGRAAAVPAPEPPLVPEQDGRIAARPVADSADIALVTGDVEGSAVVTRRSVGRSHLNLERPVDDLRIHHLEAVEIERDTDSIHPRGLLSSMVWSPKKLRRPSFSSADYHPLSWRARFRR